MDDENTWTYVGTVEDGSLLYTDYGLRKKVIYTYTVVPYVYENGKKEYGYYNWEGVSGETIPNKVRWVRQKTDYVARILWEIAGGR